MNALLLLSVLLAAGAERPMDEVIGVTHVAGAYHLEKEGGKDFMAEGADAVLGLGSKTIKLWFNLPPQDKYPFNSKWPEKFDSLVELAKHPYYRSTFEKPFKCIILVAYGVGRPEHYWTQGATPEQLADETRQFEGLTRYLLTTYKDSGKTFILQHWEGDWAIRSSYDANSDPTPTAIEGMAQWLNARQAGVDKARAAVGPAGVNVYHAAEVNLVERAMLEGKPCVTNAVLPKTKNLDLVSYSSYDTAPKGEVFRKALDFIAANMPDRAPFGAKNVYVGEYGWPENEDPVRHRETVRNVVRTAVDWGCPYVVYWELYCNEPRKKPVVANDDARGFWLIRPDGEKTWAWRYLHEVIASGNTGFEVE